MSLPALAERRLSILGATGSIGASTLNVIAELRAQGLALEIEAVTAGRNVAALAEICRAFRPRYAAIAEPALAADLRQALSGFDIELGAGPEAVIEAAERPADWVMAAIMGAAGLKPTLAAIRRGAMVAIANKETLVCAGPLVLAAARASGAQLLPVDSEHNAIFQVRQQPERIECLTLTASGGPFRTWSREQMRQARPEQACAHPSWSMGAKISVDSATLMNKGLELIEAAYLFDTPEQRIEVLVHPQSIVHSLVHYCDGSVLAQLSAPDMRTPIAHCLAWPDRAQVSSARLSLADLAALTFEAPDHGRFPALNLARQAYRTGPGALTTLNAANEVAVEAFLAGRIGFLDIAEIVEQALEALESSGSELNAKSPTSFDEVEAVDVWARKAAGAAAAKAAR